MVAKQGSPARQRYDRELARVQATADEVVRDIRQAWIEGHVSTESYDRLLDLATEYMSTMERLLRDIHEEQS